MRLVIDFYRRSTAAAGGSEVVRRVIGDFETLDAANAYGLHTTGADGFRVYEDDILKSEKTIPSAGPVAQQPAGNGAGKNSTPA